MTMGKQASVIEVNVEDVASQVSPLPTQVRNRWEEQESISPK